MRTAQVHYFHAHQKSPASKARVRALATTGILYLNAFSQRRSPVMGALEASIKQINEPTIRQIKERAEARVDMEVTRGRNLIRNGVAAIGVHASPQEALTFLKDLVSRLEVEAQP